MWRFIALWALLCGACAGGEAARPAADGAGSTPASPASVASSVTAPSSIRPPTVDTPTEEVPATMTTADAEPRREFTSAVREVTTADLGVSWRPGCPVAVEALRWIDLAHWNDDGVVVDGSIVVHADHVAAVVGVFSRLFEAGFPIHSLRPITDFAADDDASMAANNTSGFNCREISGAPGTWSQHAFGGAIDINPLVNPWVRGDRVDPPEGVAYVDRSLGAPGMVVAGDEVTRAFADAGWGWGGDWTGTKDWQHFSHNGR